MNFIILGNFTYKNADYKINSFILERIIYHRIILAEF